MLCLFFSPAYCTIEVGKTYTIRSKKYPTKSLFVENSAREVNAAILLWTETDVPSQQWKACNAGSGDISFQNVYSGYYAAPQKQTKGAVFKTHRMLSYGHVVLEAVDETAGVYHILPVSKDFYLTATTGEDGEKPCWGDKDDADEGQQWIISETEAKYSFTKAMREEMMDDYLNHFLKNKGSSMRTFVNGGWGESEQLEVVLDAYECTGNEKYLNIAKYVYNYFKNRVGDNWDHLVYDDNYHWFGHDFNDDVMWQIIAVARLGWLTGSKAYTNAAKKNFDKIYERAYIPFTGLMRWAQSSGDAYGTNSCIAGPTEVAACYLGMSGCGEDYFEKARDLYAAQRYTLANNMSTGKVWDSVVWDPDTKTVKSKNEWASTYNQGTMLGAACLLYDHYGDEQYLNDAKKIMSFTRKNLCNSYGIIKVCQDESHGDLCGFKGILMRYVRRFVLDLNQPDYKEWTERNALLAYCNRTQNGITGTGWLKKATAESTTNAFGCSTAASAAANVVLGDVVKNGFDEQQAEHFDFHCGLQVSEEIGCGNDKIVYVSNGLWAQYDNIDFGEQTAHSIILDVTAPASNITGNVEIYLDKMSGEPAGICELKDLDPDQEWHTLYANITPATGLHNVYLRFTCSSSRTKAYRIDHFQFSTQTAEEIQTGVSDHVSQGKTPMSVYDLQGRLLPVSPKRGIFVISRGEESRIISIK
ncbi:MAG: carbohydrate-binding protein [Bacteroidaceae bacterium]|nr:carbohydrate-binding protein [Bacteroidaceae bacterium]